MTQARQAFQEPRSFYRLIRPVRCFKFIYVDGSFVTNKESPGDIDVVLELPVPDRSTAIRLKNMKLSNQLYVYEKFGIHVFIYPEGFLGNDLRAFFQYLRPEEALTRGLQPGTTKVILRVAL
jgi:hypothetical protein